MVHDIIAARVVLPLLLVTLAVGGLATAPAAAASPLRCPDVPRLRCLSVTVPLDRSGAVPGTVRIRAARVVRRPGAATRAPLVALTGGPGQAGVAFANGFARELPAPDRDLVLLDQRGTGASGLLRCPAFERGLALSYFVPAGPCGVSLGARRSLYTSADTAEDIEALRVRLGAQTLALFGVSYGTRVALEYAARHPDRVERLVLDSPVPVGGPDPFARDTLAAVAPVVRAACRFGCPGGGSHPVADLRALVRRLRLAPVRRSVRRGRRVVAVGVSADDLLALLVTGDLSPPFLQDVPRAVREALRGRTRRLALMKLEARAIEGSEPVRRFSSAVFAATLCEESPVAWDRSADPATRRAQAAAALASTPDAALAPFDREAALKAGPLPICGDWPAPERAAPATPALPAVPALVLSGQLDLRTPTPSARALVAALPGARLVVERGVGHSVLGADPGGCATGAVRAFLADRTLPRCVRGR